MQSPNEQQPWSQPPDQQPAEQPEQLQPTQPQPDFQPNLPQQNQPQSSLPSYSDPLPPSYSPTLPPGYSPPLPPPTGPTVNPGYTPGAPVDNSVNGTVILVMGILGLLFCQIFGIVAWVMGNSALKTLDSGRGDPSQRQLVVVGRILGIIATVLMILITVFMIFAVAVGITTGLNHRPPTSPPFQTVPPMPR